MKALLDVNEFGAVDADADRLLEQCFEDHEAYLDAKSHRKFLVLGRKGSGKTAIYKKLLRESTYDVFSPLVMISQTILGTSIHTRASAVYLMSNVFFKVGDT